MIPNESSMTYPLDFSSFHLKKAFDRHLYISSKTDFSLSVLCYDGVLCYLSNIIDQGSLIEIEENLKRFFSFEQINQAYFYLKNSLDYSLSILDPNKDQYVYNLIQQCLSNLIDSTSLLSVIEMIYKNKLTSYLPIFVTNDWLHMIRSIQNIEKFDKTSSSISNLQQQMSYLRANMISLDNIVKNFNQISLTIQSPLSNDQCCLRTYCTHNTTVYPTTTFMESPSSSWSLLDIDTNPITPLSGFIRNPVTNFIMPTGPNEFEMETSFLPIDDNMSSDEEPEIIPSSLHLTRSLSFQPSRKRTGPILVKRADVLWVYPSVNFKPRYNSLHSSISETTDEQEFQPIFKRTNSFDLDFPVKKLQNSLPNRITKKSKKSLIKPAKGLKRVSNVLFLFFS
jgi:hypothetical protein